jgi:hypothetical protein
MYLAVGLWASMILLMASPILWVVWWLLADLGERASNPRAGNRPGCFAALPTGGLT